MTVIKATSQLIADAKNKLIGRIDAPEIARLLEERVLFTNFGTGPIDWAGYGNILLFDDDENGPNVVALPGIPMPTNALVISGKGAHLPSVITVSGDSATVLIGDNTDLPACSLFCGSNSIIFFEGQLSCAGQASVSARNGGSVHIEKRGLWSNRLYISTGDQHSIMNSETGEKISMYGDSIRVGEHVWLGLEAMILGGAKIGEDCVIGARAIIDGPVPAGSIAAGSPMRVIREGVTWTHDDRPPGRAQPQRFSSS